MAVSLKEGNNKEKILFHTSYKYKYNNSMLNDSWWEKSSRILKISNRWEHTNDQVITQKYMFQEVITKVNATSFSDSIEYSIFQMDML